jgi:DNA modification methylase
VRILQGDCRDVLKTLPDESVHCVVTSPPYFGLRDYGVAGQLGLETSLAAFIDAMVGVFEEVRRVLRSDGTAWVNMGDSYANDGKWGGHTGGKHVKALHCSPIGRNKRYTGLKPKDLCGMPWRLAFAMQEAGWWLRQDIIWAKPNPMPESVLDRCTKAHEYIFLLAKSERYYFDGDAIAEDAITEDNRRPYGSEGAWQLDGRPEEQKHGGEQRKSKMPDGWDTGQGAHGTVHRGGREKGKKVELARGFRGGSYVQGEPGPRKEVGNTYAPDGFKRNKRSVWTVATAPYKESHFATFPPALIKPCIIAGCPAGGTVLDPFFGAGTTGLVADRNGRNCIGIELNPEYAAMAERRINGDAPLFAEVKRA